MESENESVNGGNDPTSESILLPDVSDQSSLPQLDFDSSTVTASSPPTVSDLNPRASCFNCNNFSFLDAQTSFFPQFPDQASGSNGFTVNEDVIWHLVGISARLDALETAVSSGNSQINQLGTIFTSAIEKLNGSEEYLKNSIRDLKQSMKGFVKALLSQLFGQALEDTDMQEDL